LEWRTMIAKAVKGKGFRGALEYDLGKEQGRVIDTNMNGSNPRELAAEFGEIRKLRPALGKAVLHVSLSAAPGEHFIDEQWCAISQRYLRGMGLDHNQYVVTRHNDTEHEHIHLLANRIQFDGSVTSDSNDYRRQEALMREIERDLGLQPVQPSVTAERRAATKGELEHGLRIGEPLTRQQLQQLCDGAIERCTSFSDYAARLEAAGVALLPVMQLEGRKLSGLSYRLDGVTMKGSDLGKRYSPAGLAKHGVSYDKERDHEAVGHCLERSQAGCAGEADRAGEAGEARERGAAGDNARTVGTGDGGPDGRDAADLGRDRAPEPGAERAVHEAGRGGSEGVEGRGGADARRRGEPESGRAPDGVDSLPHGVNDGLDYSDARERILHLAGTAIGGQPARPEGSRGLPPTRDRSREAVERQIDAMGVERFEVLVRDQANGQELKREWAKPELLKSIAWLKRMNARGREVFVRPAGQHGLVLLDALNAEALAAMRRKGFEPAAVIESNPGAYQAWVALSARPVADQVRQLAADGLARGFNGTVPDLAVKAFGRLAGFTFDEVTRDREVSRRFVLAHEGRPTIAPNGEKLLSRIESALRALELERDRKRIKGQREGERGRSL
jgi:hypothetical protein